MRKLRLVITMDYDADPKDYGTDDVDEMCRIDQEGIGDDLGILITMLHDKPWIFEVRQKP